MVRTLGTSSALPSVAVDLLLSFAAIMLAASTMSNYYSTIPRAVPEVPLVITGGVLFALVVVIMCGFAGLYRPRPIRVWTATFRTGLAIMVGGYLTSLALRSVGDRGYIQLLIPAASIYLMFELLIVRGVMYIATSTRLKPRILIVGAGAAACKLASEVRKSGQAAREVVGFYPTRDVSDTAAINANHTVFSTDLSISSIVEKHGIDEIIVAVSELRGGHVPMDQLLACRIAGVPVLDVAAFVERTRCEVPLDSLKSSWLVYGQGFVQGTLRRGMKRIFDIIGAMVLLLVAMPVMLLTAVAIRLEGPGPIFYRQRRVGLNGKSFWCTKFRSMRCDAEQDGVARWASKDDFRTTRVGNFIRKTRIDELPQVWSVLRNDMSLVGPRPERPEFVESLRSQVPFYDLRHTVKPGITGWAQVRYQYGGSLDDSKRKHQFDLFYLKNNSIWLDFVILIETVSVVVFREGQ